MYIYAYTYMCLSVNMICTERVTTDCDLRFSLLFSEIWVLSCIFNIGVHKRGQRSNTPPPAGRASVSPALSLSVAVAAAPTSLPARSNPASFIFCLLALAVGAGLGKPFYSILPAVRETGIPAATVYCCCLAPVVGWV